MVRYRLNKNLSIIVLVGIICLYVLINIAGRFVPSSFNTESKKSSPNKEFIIYEISSLTDNKDGHAPYGQYLVLANARTKVDAPGDGYVIFAGYCVELGYSWKGDSLVEVICTTSEKKNIRTASGKAYGVEVKVITRLSKAKPRRP